MRPTELVQNAEEARRANARPLNSAATTQQRSSAMSIVTQEQLTRLGDTPPGTRFWLRCSGGLDGDITAVVPGEHMIRTLDAGQTGWLSPEYPVERWLRNVDGSNWMEVSSGFAARFASEPVAELVTLNHNKVDSGVEYVRLSLLGTEFHLSIADAVELVDTVATALAGVTV